MAGLAGRLLVDGARGGRTRRGEGADAAVHLALGEEQDGEQAEDRQQHPQAEGRPVDHQHRGLVLGHRGGRAVHGQRGAEGEDQDDERQSQLGPPPRPPRQDRLGEQAQRGAGEDDHDGQDRGEQARVVDAGVHQFLPSGICGWGSETPTLCIAATVWAPWGSASCRAGRGKKPSTRMIASSGATATRSRRVRSVWTVRAT
ncbi:hypothetical protein SDC9_96330 [bioreactor metagenome]|uniref:Uncharacterized protein n=1 Tax=bioreactor metagenome TaxID=1076179 RepID=A0A645A8U6_9ZZZZ